MGFDIEAKRDKNQKLTEEDKAAFADAEAHYFFTGQWLPIFIMGIYGEGIYPPWTPPETVRAIYEAMERCDLKVYIEADEYLRERVPIELAEHLRRFFSICAERGLGVEATS